MAVMNKPDYKVFAGSAKAGEVIAFPNVDRGWGYTLDTTGGIPPMESMNGMAKRQDEWLLYLTQQGIPEWDSRIDYVRGSVARKTGRLYMATEPNKNKDPETSQSIWSNLLADYARKDDALLKENLTQTLVDQADKIPSSKIVLSEVNKKVDTSSVKQTLGSSRSDIVSQNALTNELNLRNPLTFNQKWGSYISARNPEIEYKNQTGRAIAISVIGASVGVWARIQGYVDNIEIFSSSTGSSAGSSTNERASCFFLVPSGSSYKVSVTGSDTTIRAWMELR